MNKTIPEFTFKSKKLVQMKNEKAQKTHRSYKALFLLINVLIIISTFATLLLTTLVISKLIWKGWPTWYFAYTLGVSAIVSFVTACLNFFFVKGRYEDAKMVTQKIEEELIMYNNKILNYGKDDDDYWLAVHIYAITKNTYAAKEVENA